jgi:cation-transporting ATPase 13A2
MRRSSQSTLVTDTVLSLSPEKACPALPGSRRSVSSGSFLPLFLLRSLALTALFSSSDAVESDLRFLGLVIFENKLKPGTSPAIATFRQAHIPTRMVTGDNVRTAISVGRECAMILPTSRVFLPSFVKGAFLSLSPFRSTCLTILDSQADLPTLAHRSNGPTSRTRVASSTLTHFEYAFFPSSRGEVATDHLTIRPQPLVSDQASVFSGYSDEKRDYHLAVTGDVFRWMMDFGALETLQRVRSDLPSSFSFQQEADFLFTRRCWSRESSSPACLPTRSTSSSSAFSLSATQSVSVVTVRMTAVLSRLPTSVSRCRRRRLALRRLSRVGSRTFGASLRSSRRAGRVSLRASVASNSCALASLSCFSCLQLTLRLAAIRALYSLIQFTTVSLLYAIASTLGDFQASLPLSRS